MTAAETAIVAAIRAALGSPTADVSWRDGSSAFQAETTYQLSYVSRTRRGKDHRTLGTVTAGSAPETVTGNRVDIIQVAVETNAQDQAMELADVLSASITGTAATEILWAANLSAARPGAIRSVPYTDRHGDVRSAVVLEIAISSTRRTSAGDVPILAAAEVTGSVTPGPIAVGPGLIER